MNLSGATGMVHRARRTGDFASGWPSPSPGPMPGAGTDATVSGQAPSELDASLRLGVLLPLPLSVHWGGDGAEDAASAWFLT